PVGAAPVVTSTTRARGGTASRKSRSARTIPGRRSPARRRRRGGENDVRRRQRDRPERAKGRRTRGDRPEQGSANVGDRRDRRNRRAGGAGVSRRNNAVAANAVMRQLMHRDAESPGSLLTAPRRSVEASDPGKRHSLLTLVFPFLVLVGDRRLFVAAKEENLRDPFVRVDLRGKGSGVRDFECDVPLPLGLE